MPSLLNDTEPIRHTDLAFDKIEDNELLCIPHTLRLLSGNIPPTKNALSKPLNAPSIVYKWRPTDGSLQFKISDLGEGIVEQEIAKWYIQPGDTIVADQFTADVMTDKACWK